MVVAVNSDRSVRRLKGPGRPVQNEQARCEVLAALESVDHVLVFDAPTPIEAIVSLQPDILAKGADWAAEDIIGAPEVRSWGGRVARIRLVDGQSTTALIKRSKASDRRRKRGRATPQPPDGSSTAIASISTQAPFGKAFTATVARAGRLCPKCRA